MLLGPSKPCLGDPLCRLHPCGESCSKPPLLWVWAHLQTFRHNLTSFVTCLQGDNLLIDLLTRISALSTAAFLIVRINTLAFTYVFISVALLTPGPFWKAELLSRCRWNRFLLLQKLSLTVSQLVSCTDMSRRMFRTVTSCSNHLLSSQKHLPYSELHPHPLGLCSQLPRPPTLSALSRGLAEPPPFPSASDSSTSCLSNTSDLISFPPWLLVCAVNHFNLTAFCPFFPSRVELELPVPASSGSSGTIKDPFLFSLLRTCMTPERSWLCAMSQGRGRGGGGGGKTHPPARPFQCSVHSVNITLCCDLAAS